MEFLQIRNNEVNKCQNQRTIICESFITLCPYTSFDSAIPSDDKGKTIFHELKVAAKKIELFGRSSRQIDDYYSCLYTQSQRCHVDQRFIQ